MMRAWLLLIALLVPLSAAAVVDPEALPDPELDARYRSLIAEIRCLVCQNQSLADSNAELAVDLRDQVRTMLVEGATDEDVVAYLTARYGDFVLYRPPFRATTAALWLSPVLLFLLVAGMAWRLLRAGGQSQARKPVDEAARARIRAHLEHRE